MRKTTVKLADNQHLFYTFNYRRIGTGTQRAVDAYPILFDTALVALKGIFYKVDVQVMTDGLDSFLRGKPDPSTMVSSAMLQILSNSIDRLQLEQKYTFDRHLLENKIKLLDPVQQYFLIEALRVHVLEGRVDALARMLDAGVK